MCGERAAPGGAGEDRERRQGGQRARDHECEPERVGHRLARVSSARRPRRSYWRGSGPRAAAGARDRLLSAAAARRRPRCSGARARASASPGAGAGSRARSRRRAPLALSVAESRLLATIGASTSSASAMPAWRATSRRAASRGSRSGMSSPASAGSASPMPAPARSWGAITHHSDASGSSARQSVPAATSRQPVAARIRGSPFALRVASALSGRTETAIAAASGSSFQPATSSSTSRNRTAVSAADRSARATSGPGALGRRGWIARARRPA